MKLQFGTASTDAVREDLSHQHAGVLEQIQQGESESIYLKVVDHDIDTESGKGTMIAWADWILPEDESAPKTSGGLRGEPPHGLNLQFCGIVNRAITIMRTRVLEGKKCYMLNQLFTLPDHQRRGAGSMLLTWAFERADKEGMVCYLDTEANGKVIALYEKHGYVKVDECHVDLGVCGLEGIYTHVAMVREPKAVTGTKDSG